MGANTNVLIEDATVVTMNAQRDILTDASIAISGERIAAVGLTDALQAQYPQAERIDGRGKVVLPGLINCHTHISMSLQKGITLAVPAVNWLTRVWSKSTPSSKSICTTPPGVPM